MPQNKYYGDTGIDQLDTGGNPIFTFLSSVLNDGEVLADDGRAYSSIQTAENNASGFILIGPGTFNETVTVGVQDLTISGSGYGSHIDSGANDGVDINTSGVSLRDVSVSSEGNAVASSGADTRVSSVVVRQGGARSITMAGADSIVSGCRAVQAGFGGGFSRGMDVANSSIISSCIVESSAGTSGSESFVLGGADSIISSSISTANLTKNLNMAADDGIAMGNRMLNSADDIRVVGTGNIVAKNRVGTLSDEGTNSTIDDNETGTAN